MASRRESTPRRPEEATKDAGSRAPKLEVGSLLDGRYRVLAALGTGSMAQVWRVEDEVTGQSLALKLLSPGPREHAALLRAEFARVARLLHPNIVQVHDFGLAEDETPYFTMELVEGSPLGSRPETADASRLARLMEGVVRGLGAIHAAGLVHGDLKPENVLVVGPPPYTAESVRIVDLGLSGPTRTGPSRGTSGYAAPEVLAGEAPSPQSDLFSLGVVLYRILARMPVGEPDPLAEIILSREARSFSPMPLRAAGVSPELERIVMGLLERDPSRRTRTAADLWEALEPLARRGGTAAGRRSVLEPAPSRQALSRGVLIGRDGELSQIRAQLPLGGLPVLLTGPSGSGRTRLLRELAVQLEVEGGRTVVVSCAGRDDGGAEWMRRMRRLAGVEPEASWELTFERLAAAGFRLAVLEDLHLASDDDLAVARTALSTKRPPGLLVVLSWKEPSPDPSKRFADFLVLAHSSWTSDRPVHVALPPLDRERTAELVRALLSGSRIADLEGRVFEATGGQPVWVEMSLADLVNQGALVHDGHAWRFSAAPDVAISVPKVRDYAAAGVRGLSEDGQRWLAAVGVLGGEAPEASVLEVAETPPAAGEEVLASGLAVRRPSEAGPVILAQPLLAAEQALEALDAEARRGLHRRAALGASDDPLPRARHWLLAGEGAEVLRALDGLQLEGAPKSELWRAGLLRLEALRQLGRADAAALASAATAAQDAHRFEDATQLWAEYERLVPDAVDRATALLRIAECRRWINDFAGAESALDRVEEGLRSVSEPATDAYRRVRASLMNERSWIALARGELDQAENLARRALEITEAQDLAERFTAQNRLAAILPRAGKLAEARVALQEAFRLAREMKDEIAESRAHGNAVLLARLEGKLDEAHHHLEAVHSIGLRHNLLSLLTRDSTIRIEILDSTGSVEQLREALREGENLARLAGDLGSLEGVLHDAARLELRLGNLRRSRQLDQTSLDIDRLAGAGKRRGWVWYRVGCRSRLLGRHRRASRAFRRAVKAMSSSINQQNLVQPLTAWADLHLALGRPTAGLRLLGRALEVARANPRLQPHVARSLALASVRTGNAALAEQARGLLLDGEDLRQDSESYPMRLEASAYLEFISGGVDRAIDLWTQAASLRRSTERLLQLAEGLAEAARTLAGQSPLPSESHLAAEKWFHEARTIYQRIGARGTLAAVLSDLVRLQDSGRPSSPRESSRSDEDVLHQVSEILNSMLEFPELLGTSLRLVCERIGAERGLIVLVDGETGALDPVAQFGSPSPGPSSRSLEISTTVVRQVAQTGSVFRSEDAAADPRLMAYRSVTDFSLHSILCAPLRIRDAVAGTIYLQNRTGPGPFSGADAETLEAFANLIAIAMEKSRYQEELRRANDSLLAENDALRREVGRRITPATLIGQSPPMRRIHALVERYARVDTDVLIQGDTGTGKELVAKAIHYSSAKRSRPFLSLNCAALPEPLIEAELFGIEDHVATGVRARKGVFEQTEDGTVLLDEIGDMPRDLQARLLRVLQEREFQRVGARKPIPFRGRVIAATNADLQERVREGRFREDLYYRVRRLLVQIPPLRDRRGDLPALARFFVERFCATHGRGIPTLSPALLDTLRRSSWPGNVRELENYLESLLVMSDDAVLEPLTLPSDLEAASEASRPPSLAPLSGSGASNLAEALAQYERGLIDQAMQRAGGNQSRAARLLGVPEPTLRYRLRRQSKKAG